MEPWASCWDQNRSSPDITMSADKKNAYRTGNSGAQWVLALSTKSGINNVYVELIPTFAGTGPGNNSVGIGNINANISGIPGLDANTIGFGNEGAAYLNGQQLGTAPPYNSGDVVAIAIYGQLQLVLFRNVTQNSAWSQPFRIFLIGEPPYYLIAAPRAVGDHTYANFYGPFTGALPTAADISPMQSPLPSPARPAFTVWNPEALFSEQPVKVIDFDAILTDGSYTSSNLQDLENIPFSYVKWGDAVLDAQNNLLFTDWVIDDLPIFSIVIQAAAAGNNWLWAAWDYGTPFVFDKVHIPSTTAVAVSNIEIPPPPPTTNPQHPGQGHVLQIFSSCDNGQVFNWTQGRVHGVEDVLVWAPVEYATWPPSVIGQAQPVIGNSIQGGSWGPPIGPPLS